MANVVVTTICILVTISIWGLEFLRRVLEEAAHRLVAREAGRHVDELYFLTWNDLSNWYSKIANTNFGFQNASLEPWEANRILSIVDKNGNLGNKVGSEKKHMIIENARASLPSTFDCYRPYGTGRAVIAGIATSILASAGTSSNTAKGAAIVLGLILLTFFPLLIQSFLALARLLKSRLGTIKAQAA